MQPASGASVQLMRARSHAQADNHRLGWRMWRVNSLLSVCFFVSSFLQTFVRHELVFAAVFLSVCNIEIWMLFFPSQTSINELYTLHLVFSAHTEIEHRFIYFKPLLSAIELKKKDDAKKQVLHQTICSEVHEWSKVCFWWKVHPSDKKILSKYVLLKQQHEEPEYSRTCIEANTIFPSLHTTYLK